MMDESERMRYHTAAAEYFTADIMQMAQDALFTVAHHYNAAIRMSEQQLKDGTAKQEQIQHIVSVYYEAAKVKLFLNPSCALTMI